MPFLLPPNLCLISLSHDGKTVYLEITRDEYDSYPFRQSSEPEYVLPPKIIVRRDEALKMPVYTVLYLSSFHSSFNVSRSRARPRDSSIEEDEEGRVWVYYYDQKSDITELFDENNSQIFCCPGNGLCRFSDRQGQSAGTKVYNSLSYSGSLLCLTRKKKETAISPSEKHRPRRSRSDFPPFPPKASLLSRCRSCPSYRRKRRLR